MNQQDDDPFKKLQNQKNIVQCRICKGDHWTLKCPYKDTLEPLQQQLKEEESAASILFDENSKQHKKLVKKSLEILSLYQKPTPILAHLFYSESLSFILGHFTAP